MKFDLIRRIFDLVAPEITIESRLDEARSVMELNCTIRAYPLTNRHFWRKDGSVIQNSIKTEIRNSRLNDHTLVSHLTIKVSQLIFF